MPFGRAGRNTAPPFSLYPHTHWAASPPPHPLHIPIHPQCGPLSTPSPTPPPASSPPGSPPPGRPRTRPAWRCPPAPQAVPCGQHRHAGCFSHGSQLMPPTNRMAEPAREAPPATQFFSSPPVAASQQAQRRAPDEEPGVEGVDVHGLVDAQPQRAQRGGGVHSHRRPALTSALGLALPWESGVGGVGACAVWLSDLASTMSALPCPALPSLLPACTAMLNVRHWAAAAACRPPAPLKEQPPRHALPHSWACCPPHTPPHPQPHPASLGQGSTRPCPPLTPRRLRSCSSRSRLLL